MSMHSGHRQRLKNRYLQEGLDNFEQVNALELLLFYCVQRRDTNPLAHKLLDHFGTFSAVLDAAPEELMKVEGVTEHIAMFLSLLPDVSRYYHVKRFDQDEILNTTEKYGEYLKARFIGRENEMVFLLCLDAKCKCICCKELSEGNVNSASISIRKIVDTALRANATSVVLAHNHPSGIAIPSGDDVQTTLRLYKALRAVEITLVDHIVVADGDYVSMAQSGLLKVGDADE